MKNKPFRQGAPHTATPSSGLRRPWSALPRDENLRTGNGEAAPLLGHSAANSVHVKIAKANLSCILTALGTDLFSLSKMTGLPASGLTDVSKKRSTPCALTVIEGLENRFRRGTGWFGQSQFKPTYEDLERFRQSCSLNSLVEEPGMPVRRDTLEDYRDFVEKSNSAKLSDTPEVRVSVESPSHAGTVNFGQNEDEDVFQEVVRIEEPVCEVPQSDSSREHPEVSAMTYEQTLVGEEDLGYGSLPYVDLAAEGTDETAPGFPGLSLVDGTEGLFLEGESAVLPTTCGVAEVGEIVAPLSSVQEVGIDVEAVAACDPRAVQVLENLSRLSAALDCNRSKLCELTGITGSMVAELRQGVYSDETCSAVRSLERRLMLISYEFEDSLFNPTPLLLAHLDASQNESVQTRRPARQASGNSVAGSIYQGASLPGPSEELRTEHLRAVCQEPKRRFGVRAVTGISQERLDAALRRDNPLRLTQEEEQRIQQAFFLGDDWFSSTRKHARLKGVDFIARLNKQFAFQKASRGQV